MPSVSSQSSDPEIPASRQSIYPDGTPRRIRRQRAVQETIGQTPAEILGLAVPSSTGTPTVLPNSLEEEFNSYLDDSSGKECADILAYWQVRFSMILIVIHILIDYFEQENQLRFPILFRAALDYLAIQASSVPCERVFSSAKETMTARQSRISPGLMEALQMLKFSLNHGKGLSFSRGLAENLKDEIEQHLQSVEADT